MRAWKAAASEPWAITETWLQTILDIAARDQKDDIEAVVAKVGRPMNNTRTVTVRDGVATIPVAGPMFRYANMFTEISGATSIDVLAKEFAVAVSDPSIKSIILNMDSPGGQVNGTAEFADMIYAARSVKPVIAYVDGSANSAAYWLASAASRIVVGKTATVGSIGVIGTVTSDKPVEGSGTYQFISSQSPHKRVDPATTEGAARLQTHIDQLASIFIADVARGRGTTPENVAASYGGGGVMLPVDALAAGMIDEISTYENLLQALASGTPGRVAHSPKVNAKEIPSMTDTSVAAPVTPEITAAFITEGYADIAASFRAEGAKAERDRLAGIDAVALPGLEKIAAECKADINCTPEAAAVKMVLAAKEPGTAYLAAQRVNDAGLPVIAPAVDAAPAAEAEAARIANLPLKDRLEHAWKADPVLRAEFADNFDAYLAFEENNSAGRVRILRAKTGE